MRYFAVACTLLAYGLALGSVLLVSYLKLESWRMVLPLVCMSLAMLLWAATAAGSLVLMLRHSPRTETFYVYGLNIVLTTAPLLYFAWQMVRYPGPRTQFLFEWFTKGTTHLLDR